MTKTQATVLFFIIAIIIAFVAMRTRHLSPRPGPSAPVERTRTPAPRPADACAENPALDGCAKGA